MKSTLNNDSPVSERFKMLIVKLGLNQREFCQAAKIDAGAFNRVVNGHGLPSFDALALISSAFPQINIDYLLNGKGEVLADNGDKLKECEVAKRHLEETLVLKDRIITLLEAQAK